GGVFRVEHPEFLLFPTYLHQSPEGLVPAALKLHDEARAEMPGAGKMVFRHCARVTDQFLIDSPEELPRLRGYHVWSEAVVAERFHRWQKALHVLLVRVSALPQPATVPLLDSYAGCRSWVELDEDVDVSGTTPVLSEVEYSRRVKEILAAVS